MKDGKSFDPEKLSVKARTFELAGVQLVSIHVVLSISHDSLESIRSAYKVAAMWLLLGVHEIRSFVGRRRFAPLAPCSNIFRTTHSAVSRLRLVSLSQCSTTDSASSLAGSVTIWPRPPDRSQGLIQNNTNNINLKGC